MNKNRLLPLVVVGAAFGVLAGCPSNTQGPVSTKPGLTATRGSGGCESASLALDPTRVVATVEGQPVTAADLGPEFAAAEKKALRTYCDAISSQRDAMLENHIAERLVKKAADAQAKPVEQYLKDSVEARMGTPSDAEIQAFYDARKGEGVPPLADVKDQVVNAIKREKSEGIVRAIVEDMKKAANVTTSLPDVAAPPVEIDVPSHVARAGKHGSKVRVVEFADFECPYCSVAAQTLGSLKQRFGDRVEFNFRHFPLSFHPNARRAAEYAQCAGAQGKFWEMHDKIFTNTKAIGEADLKGHVASVGLDVQKLDACLASGQASKEVDIDYNKGMEIGVEGTPSFFINGRVFSGNPTPEGLAAAIEKELQKT